MKNKIYSLKEQSIHAVSTTESQVGAQCAEPLWPVAQDCKRNSHMWESSMYSSQSDLKPDGVLWLYQGCILCKSTVSPIYIVIC